jgi:OPA family glycerol-3-phosphate transporter-like MFS transporter
MGILSLSFLFGDAAARQFMSVLIAHGLGWRGVFYAAAATLGALLVLNAVLLRESPRELGLPEPAASPENLFGAGGEKHRPPTLRALLGTFAHSRMFWLVCLISLGVTLVRETFNLWMPTYFTQAVGLSNAEAAQKSALFPLFGGISVILAGVLSDRLGRNGRASILFAGLLLAGGTLCVMGCFDPGSNRLLPVALVALVGFLIIGPYSYLAGAMSLDFGGKQGSATASGLIDGVGYLGGVLAGNSMAALSIAYGWRGAFLVLAGAAWLASLGAGIYLLLHSRQTAASRPE